MSTQPASLSSSTPPASSKILPPPPPTGLAGQKKTPDFAKKTTSSMASLGSGGLQDSPVLMSNNEIFDMMRSLRQQMSQQKEDNMTLLKEMERMKAEFRKSQETTPSILQPRILNFDGSGSSRNRQETAIPASLSAPTLDNRTPVIQDPERTYATPMSQNNGNFVDNNTINTNSADLDT